jgi:deoxyribonuclease-4
MFIGCHLSTSNGFLGMGRDALSIGANTFQFFTRNPRGGKAKELDQADIDAFLALATENHFGPLLAHAPYTMNPCSADENTRRFALETMQDDLQRMARIPGNLYNFHPGSHVGQGEDAGIAMIVAQLNTVLSSDMQTTVLLETMAGKGSEVGRTFDELRRILDGVVLNEKMGVCLDTCHINDAGYDLVNDLDGVLETFDCVVGLNRLKAVHLNDSMNPLGARKDRHACIGQGHLGLEAITRFINHPALRHLPFLLETPNELPGYKEEIALLRSVRQTA